MMRKTGMLVCTNPSKFAGFLPQIKKGVDTTLYIQFLPRNQLPLIGKKDTAFGSLLGPKFSPVMQQLYKHSCCLGLDVRVLLGAKCPIFTIPTKKQVEIVYFDVDLTKESMESFIKHRLDNHSSNCEPVVLEGILESYDGDIGGFSEEEVSNHVAVGGTFDRLHTGHKMLLSEAALLTKKKLLVGLTDTEMLKTKTLWELIQPYNERADRVRQFLSDVQPALEVNVVPINDVYGPTKDDRSLEALVVSAETIKGGYKINEMREKNNLTPLKIRSIDLVNEEFRCWDVEETKISSSNGRLRLLGTLLKAPVEEPNRPSFPFVIGLTGGIASGKTSVSQRLARYGATVVDADKVAHSVYNKTESGYTSIVNYFGESILDPNTMEIDRRKLGSIVFSDKKKLQMLNRIVWPRTMARCEELICAARESGAEVVVIEATLLIEANWHKTCHEIWTCIIPIPEAIKRVQNRNNLSEEDAKARIDSQISNSERVALSNVVFCTLWPPEYTDLQVERAWKGLQERLPKNQSS